MSERIDKQYEAAVPSQDPPRVRVLSQGIGLTVGDRNEAYGDPAINLDLQMRLWNCYRNTARAKHTEAHDAAMQHVFAKIARVAAGAFREDNYIDMATYAAIAYECEHNRQLNDAQSIKVGHSHDSNS